jgi:hypothetical protein
MRDAVTRLVRLPSQAGCVFYSNRIWRQAFSKLIFNLNLLETRLNASLAEFPDASIKRLIWADELSSRLSERAFYILSALGQDYFVINVIFFVVLGAFAEILLTLFTCHTQMLTIFTSLELFHVSQKL